MSRNQVRLFPDVIRGHRVAAGLSQEQAAARLTITLRTLQRWEDGTTEPRRSQLDGLAEAYGISVSELLGIDSSEAAA